MAKNLPVITWDYDFSPYGQKIRTLLKAGKVKFETVEQPAVLPRPDLTALGITYRRIPVTSFGKDVYCDSSAIIDAIERIHGGLPTTKADKAYELFGTNVLNSALPVIPEKLLTKDFKKDREAIFPILSQPNLKELRPSAVAEMQSHMHEIEQTFLKDSPFIGGQELSVADIHVLWSIRWLLETLEMSKEPGCGPDAFPKLYKWIERFPKTDVEKIDAKKASDTILNAGYLNESEPFDEKDALGIPKGTKVNVENRDTTPGAHPQAGKLIGLSRHELVIELDNGIRVHFPRAGYAVYKA